MALRRLEIGIGLSALLHGVAVAWALAAKPEHEVMPPDPIVEIEILPATPAAKPAVKPDVVVPIDVAIVPQQVTAPALPPPPPPVASPETPRPSPTPHGAAIESHTGPSTTEITEPGTGTGTVPDPNATGPAKPGVLTMRTGPDLKSHVRGSYKDAYDMPECKPPDCTPPPPPPPTSGQMHESGGGTYTSDQGSFVVHVDPDGSAHVADADNVGAGESSGRDATHSTYVDDGSPTGDVDRTGGVGNVGVTVAHFDVTDALMRRHGIDPYAAAKLKVLDATRDERVEVGKKYKAKQLKQTPAIVSKNLSRLFAQVPDAAGRKEALFEMWDESIDTGTEDAIAAGEQARKLVIAAIRSHLPAGSADAYTAAELAELNAHRSSKVKFAPYD